MNAIWQLSNDTNFSIENRQNTCGSENIALEMIKRVPLFPLSLIRYNTKKSVTTWLLIQRFSLLIKYGVHTLLYVIHQNDVL